MTTVSPGPAAVSDLSESGPRIEERRERQRQEARKRILDATEALMIEANGSDFSIRKLGDRSGYSAPTVYHYFGDKDGLIDALLDDRVARLAADLEQIDPEANPRARLRAVLLAYFEFSVTNPAFTRLMWTLSRKGESRMPPAMARVRQAAAESLDRFGSSRLKGHFDTDSAGRSLWALAFGLVALRLTQPDLTWDDSLAERALDALFLGIAELETAS